MIEFDLNGCPLQDLNLRQTLILSHVEMDSILKKGYLNTDKKRLDIKSNVLVTLNTQMTLNTALVLD